MISEKQAQDLREAFDHVDATLLQHFDLQEQHQSAKKFLLVPQKYFIPQGLVSLTSRGYRPATLDDLLRFKLTNPDLASYKQIIATGSVYEVFDGDTLMGRVCPEILKSDGRLMLDLFCISEPKWRPVIEFNWKTRKKEIVGHIIIGKGRDQKIVSFPNNEGSGNVSRCLYVRD